MAVLVLLNGPPASGKSTIAQRFVDSRPLSLNLDIDVVRGMLGGWLDDPSTAGLTARSLALVMAESHLAAGRVLEGYIADETIFEGNAVHDLNL